MSGNNTINLESQAPVLKRKRENEGKIRFVTQLMLGVRLDPNPEISGTFPRLCSSVWPLFEKSMCYIYKTINDNYDA